MAFLDFQARKGLLIAVLAVLSASQLPVVGEWVNPILGKTLVAGITIGAIVAIVGVWLVILAQQKKL